MKEKNNIEKAAADKQAGLISEALQNAAGNKGVWLNAQGKQYPKLYPKGVAVSPFNALVMALHSDKTESHTNLFTTYSGARSQGMPVREHEKGVPFLFYNWNRYVDRNNPDKTISRADYLKLSEAEQKQYKGVHNREVRTLFTLDQTTMPFSREKEYDKVVKENGTAEDRGMSDADDRKMHIHFNDFLLKMRDNLVAIRTDGSGLAHYDSEKDAIYLPRQKDFEHYHDYVQESLRQIVSATGHQQRLAREGMVMKNGVSPSEDALKQERLVVELASGVKMMEMGLPAKLSAEGMRYADYWRRELKENPCLIDAVEADVNNALGVMRKAERGEKIEYDSLRNHKVTEELKDQLPKHYNVADEIKKHPDQENRTIVLVINTERKSADVVLPEGASLEPDVELQGMSKQRIERALNREGITDVHFFNPDGTLGYRPDDRYFADKQISVARLNNWQLVTLSQLDASAAVRNANTQNFDQVQMAQDDKNRWALYIKPEGREGYSVYPDKADTNKFFMTLKQNLSNIDAVRMELANKYHTMVQAKPDLKVDLFGGNAEGIDLNKIERVSVFKAKSGAMLCAATIDGERQQPRRVTQAQWQRIWLAEDKVDYKKHLAASLFADVLQQGQAQEQTKAEKEEKAVETMQNVDNAEKQSEETKTDEVASSALLKQWTDLKAKHPDAVLLFRKGDFYDMYNQDAETGRKVLGITMQNDDSVKAKGFEALAAFPFHALDTYLPKLIRAGNRVAICDQLEASKRQQQQMQGRAEQHSGGIRR